MVELDKQNNQNNQNDYEPNNYNRYEQNIRSYYDPNMYSQQSPRINGINTPKPNIQINKKLNKKDLIFILWFIGSIILDVFLSKIGLDNISVSVFGLTFLISGIFASFKDFNNSVAFKLFISVFILVGAFLTMAGVTFGVRLTSFQTKMAHILNPITAIILVGVGLFILISNIASYNKMNNIFTENVDAIIRELKVRRGSGDDPTTYCPVYEYKYKSKLYIYSSNIYTNIRVKPVGTHINNMYINPLNPQEAYIKSKASVVVMSIVSIIVIALGVFTIINNNLIVIWR